MNQKFAEYQESQKKKREEDMHYAKNKRLILSKRDERHFRHPNFKGEDFSKVEQDGRKLHMRSLLPLDRKPLQTAGSLRTKKDGEYFGRTIGSIC